MDRRDPTGDKGSVRRARERIGASLAHIQPDPSPDQSWLRSPDPSAVDIPQPRDRSGSQTSGQWPLATHRDTAQDILQHPLMTQPPPQPSQFKHYPRPESNGELLTSFKFPSFPPPPPQPQPPPTAVVPPRRSRDLVPPPTSRRPAPAYHYDNPKAHVSPIVEEAPESSLRSRSILSRASSGVLANLSTPNLATIDQSEYDGSSRASTPPLPYYEPQIIRQASLGKKAKPAITNIRSWQTSEKQSQSNVRQEQPSREAALSALSAAVASGMGSHHHDVPDIHTPTGGSRSQTPGGTIRMPFSDETISPPMSPRSMETSLGPSYEQPRYFDNHHAYGTGSTKSKSPLLTPDSEHSPNNSHFQAARPGLSEKLPSSKRPPPLDFDNVTAAERSSTTSLADLIKRATKLAANLDRGKTASRLGMLDMFYGDGERPKRRDPNEKRESGISDMLGAFPGTPMGLGSEKGAWPDEGIKMSRLPSRQALRDGDRKKGRRCCGMSLTMFILVLVLLVILIAAAVLVPIFLILVPRMNRADSTNNGVDLLTCTKQFKCENGGQHAVVASNCGCICAGGFTGDHCTKPKGLNCTTAAIGGIQDATVGPSILSLLHESEKNFSIPLESSTILGLFSFNNLSCMDEDALVDFTFQDNNQKRDAEAERLYPVMKLELDTLDQDQFVSVGADVSRPQSTAKPELLARAIAERYPGPSAIATSNGVVFQASTTTAVVPTTASASATSATSSSPSSPSTTLIPQKSIDFAKVVVLYVLEQSATLSMAVNAHLVLQNYLAAGDSGTVEVGFNTLSIRADFGPAGPRILLQNGTVVGA